MKDSQPRGILKRGLRRRVSRGLAAAFLAVFLLVTGTAHTAGDKGSPVDPLPQDSGVAGLKQMLLRLSTTARLMQTTAHPDDEDGGMLTLESRGHGVATLLLTLTRGEGGQNKLGSNLFDVLGVLRTLELLASDRYYGVEQRFTRVADFGYSKNPKETFRAAADPKRFPEQIAEGLQPWQAKKLYVGNVCGFGASTCPAENYTVKLNTGEVSPALGMSYVQFAMQGLKHQLSQGAGGWSVEPGD